MAEDTADPELTLAEIDAQLTGPGQPLEVGQEIIRGIPTRVWRNSPATLGAVLGLSRGHGDTIFLVYEDERTSFEEHFRRAAGVARLLVDGYGVKPGDRVAIAMRNFPEWPLAFWGAAAAGAIVVPLNAWWTTGELAYGLSDSGTTVLFADDERWNLVADQVASLGVRTVVVRAEGALSGAERFEDVVEDLGAGATLPDVGVAPDDDATIFYTSGTTGRPKGAVGSHRNICSNLLNLSYTNARGSLRSRGQRSGARAGAGSGRGGQNAYLLSVPFFHATGCHSIMMGNTAAGGKLVMMYRWNPERALELIERERITTFGGVPAMVMQVLDSPDFGTRDTSSVRAVAYGGAPAPPELVRRIKEHFPGGQASNGYGLTETSSVSTMNNGPDYVRKPDSVGPPVPVVEVQVVDDEGRPLAVGEIGELWIKGPNVVRGYWNQPEATAASFTDGWLHTGDVARLDEEGFVYIVDRAKDMVIRGGENVYCVEVEAALYEHPAVADCAVIGVPHPTLGEEVGAVIRLRPGSEASPEELAAHVRTRLASFKVPTHFWFRDEELPRNPAGKVLKRELREELMNG